MPVTPTYPGVYIEEIPSGVRTITGVATSITAFIGSAPRGPVNDPITINNYGDYERNFGGLALSSPMSYAVRDFYLNGGSQAIIVRLFNPTFMDDDERDDALAAAQGVSGAAEMEAAKVGPTAVSVASAARTAANSFSNDPEKTATDFVADAAEVEAAKASSTAASVASAARTAANSFSNDPEKTVTDFVADAAEVEAAKASPTAASVASVARTTANSFSNDPEKTAADFVADMAEAKAAQIGATAQQVADAAKAAIVLAVPLTKAKLNVSGLNLEAANEGAWGNGLEATIDLEVETPLTQFNLTIRDGSTSKVEKFRNLSVQTNHARRVDNVLRQESQLMRVLAPLPTTHPTANSNVVQIADQASDGLSLEITSFTSGLSNKTGIFALENADLFNLLCIPPFSTKEDMRAVLSDAAAYCRKRRAFLLVDPPSDWTTKKAAMDDFAAASNSYPGLSGPDRNYAAIFFPQLKQPNPLHDNQLEDFVPCGAVAGIFARTDATRGVWKAPAGQDAGVVGAPALSVPLTDAENGELNQLGINCLRSFPVTGRVVWGARTLEGADRLASEWKYIPVRRTALFIEESLYRGTQWVVFEPNDEPLWAQIRLNLGAFMHNLFRQGAFQGKTPREAYFVKCDKETTTQNDINLGIVNILVGFAPLKPAEFVIIKIQQMTGQIEV